MTSNPASGDQSVRDADDLREMLVGGSRVWVIADERVQWISSAETRDVLATDYETYHSDDLVTTFVHAADHLRDHTGENIESAPNARLSPGQGDE